jgi:formylglycine-generating enzyme required for sulfatase activity
VATTLISKRKKQITVYKESLDAESGIALSLVLIPAGEFLMGYSEGEDSYDKERELPRHRVAVESFLMGQVPVTQEQWAAVAGWEKVAIDLKDPDPSVFKGANRPIERVSWEQAMEFCARLSRKTGKDYRLPTEAQWEYACRARTTTPFHFGETLSTDLANYNGTDEQYGAYGRGSKGEYRRETTPVGSFPSNEWGLYDMHGNVWEWCLDPWHDSYAKKTQTDSEVWDENNDNHYHPLDENSLNVLFKDRRRRIRRGGSWVEDPWNCRSADRGRYNPVIRGSSGGFRVVCRFPRS